MAELIEKDGKSIIVTQNEIDLSDFEHSIKITQASIDSIDHNMKGLQQRRDKLAERLNQFNAIKDSLPVKVTASAEPLT